MLHEHVHVYINIFIMWVYNNINAWYMHNPESVQENETHKFPCNFEVHTDHLISVRRPKLMIVKKKKKKKKNLPNSTFAVLCDD